MLFTILLICFNYSIEYWTAPKIYKDKTPVTIATGKSSTGCNYGSGSCKTFLNEGGPLSTDEVNGYAYLDAQRHIILELDPNSYKSLSRSNTIESPYLRQEDRPIFSEEVVQRLYKKDTIINILPGYYPIEEKNHKIYLKY